MAVTYNVFDVADFVQQQLNDPNAAWLSTTAINTVIARHAIPAGAERTFYFYKQTTGLYLCTDLGESGAIWFKIPATPWTAASTTATFEVDCRGTITVSAGTDAETSPIAFIGTRIDIGEVMGELLMLKASRSVTTKLESISLGGASHMPILPEERLIRMAEWWRGFQ